jgi:hypothetical protein
MSMKTIKLMWIIYSIMLLFSCKTKNLNKEINKIDEETNGMELFYKDYEIVYYNEIRINDYEIQMNLKLKIINVEKLNELNNSIDPISYVHFNNKKNRNTR